jgi:hypothetical protein
MLQAEAEKLAEKIVGLDEAIFTAGVISNTGETLGGFVRRAYRSKYPVDKARWASVDFKQALVFGSARGTNAMLSDIEAILFVRVDSKQILVWDQEKGIIVTALFKKSLNDTDIIERIRKLLGIG